MTDEVGRLFERQIRSWPALARGVDGLARARARPLKIGASEVLVRHIPHRIRSTTAPVDSKSIASRACFLCLENLPKEEEGIPFGDDYTIYCNPYPIVENHLTIAHREHRPQRIAGAVGRMADLAACLPGYFVIYNGPECGASAPDHMHFQAGLRGVFPIERDTAGLSGPTVPGYSRSVLLLRSRNRTELVDCMDYALAVLADTTARRPEPLVNIALYANGGEWITYLFPRSKHRPDAYFTGELTVSPATIDLCGIFVVPLERDFDRITSDAIAAIFREVTLPDDRFREVVERLEMKL